MSALQSFFYVFFFTFKEALTIYFNCSGLGCLPLKHFPQPPIGKVVSR